MRLEHLRYCDTPFPPYRYVPGINPHPTAHPQGHSYEPPGSPRRHAPYVPPERWRKSDAYLYGCDLYNHGYWWEAHEAWEGLWQVTDKRGVQGRFLQALIQVAACHLKLYQGKAEGVRSLLASSSGHIGFVLHAIGRSPFMGLAFAEWSERVAEYYRSRSAHDAASYPYVGLALSR